MSKDIGQCLLDNPVHSRPDFIRQPFFRSLESECLVIYRDAAPRGPLLHVVLQGGEQSQRIVHGLPHLRQHLPSRAGQGEGRTPGRYHTPIDSAVMS